MHTAAKTVIQHHTHSQRNAFCSHDEKEIHTPCFVQNGFFPPIPNFHGFTQNPLPLYISQRSRAAGMWVPVSVWDTQALQEIRWQINSRALLLPCLCFGSRPFISIWNELEHFHFSY